MHDGRSAEPRTLKAGFCFLLRGPPYILGLAKFAVSPMKGADCGQRRQD